MFNWLKEGYQEWLSREIHWITAETEDSSLTLMLDEILEFKCKYKYRDDRNFIGYYQYNVSALSMERKFNFLKDYAKIVQDYEKEVESETILKNIAYSLPRQLWIEILDIMERKDERYEGYEGDKEHAGHQGLYDDFEDEGFKCIDGENYTFCGDCKSSTCNNLTCELYEYDDQYFPSSSDEDEDDVDRSCMWMGPDGSWNHVRGGGPNESTWC